MQFCFHLIQVTVWTQSLLRGQPCFSVFARLYHQLVSAESVSGQCASEFLIWHCAQILCHTVLSLSLSLSLSLFLSPACCMKCQHGRLLKQGYCCLSLCPTACFSPIFFPSISCRHFFRTVKKKKITFSWYELCLNTFDLFIVANVQVILFIKHI